MSRTKEMVSENIGTREMGTDEFGYYPGEAEAELEAFMNTPEAQLAGFTTQQLNDEIYRRLFEPYNKSLRELRDKLDNIKPF